MPAPILGPLQQDTCSRRAAFVFLDIARLGEPNGARPTTLQRTRLGESLLQAAALRAVRVSLEFGHVGILAHTQDESVIPFYERYGFVRLHADRGTLLLTMNAAKATTAAKE